MGVGKQAMSVVIQVLGYLLVHTAAVELWERHVCTKFMCHFGFVLFCGVWASGTKEKYGGEGSAEGVRLGGWRHGSIYLFR